MVRLLSFKQGERNKNTNTTSAVPKQTLIHLFHLFYLIHLIHLLCL
jgi:hypothetical protein